ncbi:hypothetical protein NQ317_012091 [Molorchus minor]|uniref:Odorant receptor n=1 Tax=Molorchus minor TaxID=1323400 RepID=A0ABQ9JL13_9CUCU|nr:hypothetical protein NQ317_012091 [Molorchus minor]
MKIFPKNDHFKITMYVNFLLGVWPFVFEDSPFMKKLYNFYANFTFLYFLFFIITAYMELFVLIFAEDKDVQGIVSNLCITLLYSITIMRVYAIKSKGIKDLIREVLNMERVIYKCRDEELIDIYKSHARQSIITNLIFSSILKIFPKNDHFKITMYVNFLLGVWPFVFEDSPFMKKLYNFYANFTFLYFLFFIITAYMELFTLIFAEDKDVQGIVSNLCITLLYSITIMRVYAINVEGHQGPQKGGHMEIGSFINARDEELIDIYKSHARLSIINITDFLVNVIETLFYGVHPLYLGQIEKFNKVTNETTVIKALPLSSWFPYNPQEYYLYTYLWQIFDGLIGASYVMYIDVFSFSLIIYPLGQIKMLMYILRNFHKYVGKTQNVLGVERDEASFLTMREFIMKHKEIIRYINEYNCAMKHIMVLDFLQSSLQLASIVMQLFVVSIKSNYKLDLRLKIVRIVIETTDRSRISNIAYI